MNFQVPQFTDVEDRVLGPLSFKQFLYVTGGFGLGYLFFEFLSSWPLVLKVIPVILAGGFGLALAFYKVNNQPLINVLESAFNYYTHAQLYLWKKSQPASRVSKELSPQQANTGIESIPKLSASKLKDLTWSLDVNEKIK